MLINIQDISALINIQDKQVDRIEFGVLSLLIYWIFISVDKYPRQTS